MAQSAQKPKRPYKKVAREQAQERTRAALLDAAMEEFYGGHWQETSLDALAARAGVTKQTLLRHFGSKDGLLLQALVRSASEVYDQRWSVAPGDVEAAIDNLIDHYEEWGKRSLRIGAWHGGPRFLTALSQAARQIHYRWVEHAFERWLEPLEGPARAHRRAALIAVCDVHAWSLLANDLELPRDEVKAVLVDIVQGVIRH